MIRLLCVLCVINRHHLFILLSTFYNNLFDSLVCINQDSSTLVLLIFWAKWFFVVGSCPRYQQHPISCDEFLWTLPNVSWKSNPTLVEKHWFKDTHGVPQYIKHILDRLHAFRRPGGNISFWSGLLITTEIILKYPK